MFDETFYLSLSWQDCYALRALLRDHAEADPRLQRILERLQRQRRDMKEPLDSQGRSRGFRYSSSS